MLLNDDNADILYNNKTVLFVNAINGNRYNTLLESSDTRFLGLLRELNVPAAQQTRQSQVVCRFVEMVLWAFVQGVWKEVIKQVEECHTEPAPDTTDNGSSGSTYHNGQGGNSNYDVNKYLK